MNIEKVIERVSGWKFDNSFATNFKSLEIFLNALQEVEVIFKDDFDSFVKYELAKEIMKLEHSTGSDSSDIHTP
ncbi:hypothetical protein [Macrococcus armenti]|uniref:hypothetical protein n=1 Tax=Macrococcus armenti TaxID=2875764 RepID=UPI001CCE9079|nr:hypothetical protein [Macrococcus armenti]UBH07874.1 hypothetical protein LAU41_07510 [Macrococcus armenti]